MNSQRDLDQAILMNSGEYEFKYEFWLTTVCRDKIITVVKSENMTFDFVEKTAKSFQYLLVEMA